MSSSGKVSAGSTFIGAIAYYSTSQSIANLTQQALLCDTNLIDTSSIHSTTVNTSRFTVPAGYAGKWSIAAQAQWVPGSVGARQLSVFKNGVQQQGASVVGGVTSNQSEYVEQTLQCAVGDYLEIYAFQNSGAPVSISTQGMLIKAQFMGF